MTTPIAALAPVENPPTEPPGPPKLAEAELEDTGPELIEVWDGCPDVLEI